jgi:hypothetical protein
MIVDGLKQNENVLELYPSMYSTLVGVVLDHVRVL